MKMMTRQNRRHEDEATIMLNQEILLSSAIDERKLTALRKDDYKVRGIPTTGRSSRKILIAIHQCKSVPSSAHQHPSHSLAS